MAQKKVTSVQVQFPSNGPCSLQFGTTAEHQRFLTLQSRSRIKAGYEKYLCRLQELTRLQVPETLRKSLPPHFHSFARAFIAITEDGIAIRFEPLKDATQNEVIVTSFRMKLAHLLPLLSVGLVQVSQDGQIEPPPEGLTPPTISLGVYKPTGEQVNALVNGAEFLMTFNMPSAKTAIGSSAACPPIPQIRNLFEIGLEGLELYDQSKTDGGGRNFYIRSKFSFPLFWTSIAAYPWADYKEWRKADFTNWAERHFYEIAFGVASQEYSWANQTSQSKLREYYKTTLEKLDLLLANQDSQEEDFQKLLSMHPELLVPGYKKVLPKLAFGAHITDFVIEDATGNYLLVELESPIQPLFVKTGHPSSKLTHAKGQVDDWIRYIQDNKSTVERELGLHGISAQPSALVVIGRSALLSEQHRRKLQVDSSKTEVLTYDDLRARFVKTIENLIGILSHVGQNYEVAYHQTGSPFPSLRNASLESVDPQVI
jgi:Domain of unknown function (DUF4263)